MDITIILDGHEWQFAAKVCYLFVTMYTIWHEVKQLDLGTDVFNITIKIKHASYDWYYFEPPLLSCQG